MSAGDGRAPLIVVPTAAAVEVTARRLREGGHRAQQGFELPGEPFDLAGERLLCAGKVTTPDEAVAAVVAAVRGTGLIVAVDLPGEEAAGFLADLARIGPVVRPRTAPAAAPQLSPEHRRLLDLLAGGATVPEAARELYLSVRTAERRIGEIRRTLGVRTTAEAVIAARSGAGDGDGNSDSGDGGGDWGWPAGGTALPSVPMEREP